VDRRLLVTAAAVMAGSAVLPSVTDARKDRHRAKRDSDKDRRRAKGHSGVVEVEGIGVSLSREFSLAPDRYRVKATLTDINSTGFICTLHGPKDFEEQVFNELTTKDPGNVTFEHVVTTTEKGNYFFEVSKVQADLHWKIEVSPI
jgi:hypothetical protein